MDTDKTSTGDLLWLIMMVGLVIGAILTFFGLMLEEMPVTVVGVIFLAFGAGALFTRLNRR